MNIFVLDWNFTVNASYHVDSHVRKILLEAAQMLCTVHWQNENEAPYKPTHVNHPCNKWARQSLGNYLWLCRYGEALYREFEYRFSKVHKTSKVIEWCKKHIPKIDNKELLPFALAMPDCYKCKCPVESYRQYYIHEKKHLLQYTKRKIPKFLR